MPPSEASKRLRRLRSKAQSKALTQLTMRYRDRYVELYQQHRARGRNPQSAQSRARMTMAKEYPAVFRKLYDQQWARVQQ